MATITEEPELQLDSGMGSSDARSPEVKSLLPEEDEDDEEDETLVERLVGLTEMFPESVRNFSYSFGVGLKRCVKGAYTFTCNSTWIVFSTSTILFAPLILETERAQIKEAQRTQQKQVLLGTNPAAHGAIGMGNFPAPPR